jgi:hypothetical protein
MNGPRRQRWIVGGQIMITAYEGDMLFQNA